MGRVLLILGIGVLLTVGGSPAQAQNVCDGVSTSGNTDLKSVLIAQGFTAPIAITHAPGDPDRVYIVDQSGVIFVKRRGEDPAAPTDTFIDLTDRVYFNFTAGEAGLLGLAFDPDFETNDRFYVHYNTGTGFFCGSCATRVSRFTALDRDNGDTTSEEILINFPQPQSNHNGGQLMFGDDGFLYIFLGDGGGADDNHGACGYAQDLGQPFGKILRLDVENRDPAGTAPDTACYTSASGYQVPSSNAFVDGIGPNCDEIWAYGLRNPFRASFDRATADLYVADVGQQCWEEVNYVETPNVGPVDGGENYGWNVMEGLHCFNPSPNRPERPDCVDVTDLACGSDPACNDASLTLPVLEYQNPGGAAVIGGYVYRGCRMPNFEGTYLYADNGDGWVRSFEIDAGGNPVNQQDWTAALGGPFGSLTSFGEDLQGEHYFADAGNGTVRKILPPFADLEVSGSGAADQFLLHRTADWTWEDVNFSTMHPVDFYRVYRGKPNDVFECIHSTNSTVWTAGGDTTTPLAGELLAYLVTAVFGAEETSGGEPPRNLTNPCPAP